LFGAGLATARDHTRRLLVRRDRALRELEVLPRLDARDQRRRPALHDQVDQVAAGPVPTLGELEAEAVRPSAEDGEHRAIRDLVIEGRGRVEGAAIPIALARRGKLREEIRVERLGQREPGEAEAESGRAIVERLAEDDVAQVEPHRAPGEVRRRRRKPRRLAAPRHAPLFPRLDAGRLPHDAQHAALGERGVRGGAAREAERERFITREVVRRLEDDRIAQHGQALPAGALEITPDLDAAEVAGGH
jgi:hypothetical protein